MIAWVEPDMRADLQASQKGGSGKPLRSVVPTLVDMTVTLQVDMFHIRIVAVLFGFVGGDDHRTELGDQVLRGGGGFLERALVNEHGQDAFLGDDDASFHGYLLHFVQDKL